MRYFSIYQVKNEFYSSDLILYRLIAKGTDHKSGNVPSMVIIISNWTGSFYLFILPPSSVHYFSKSSTYFLLICHSFSLTHVKVK